MSFPSLFLPQYGSGLVHDSDLKHAFLQLHPQPGAADAMEISDTTETLIKEIKIWKFVVFPKQNKNQLTNYKN